MKTNIKWSDNAKRKLADCRPLVRGWVQRHAQRSARSLGLKIVTIDSVDSAVALLGARGISFQTEPDVQPMFCRWQPWQAAERKFEVSRHWAVTVIRHGRRITKRELACPANVVTSGFEILARKLGCTHVQALLLANSAGEIADGFHRNGRNHQVALSQPRS